MATRKASSARSSKPTGATRITRAAAARSPAVVETPTTNPPPPEKIKTKRPAVNRDNVASAAPKISKAKTPPVVDTGDREPIKAFLRIRPNIGDTEHSSTPYLKSLTPTTVQMTDPSGTNRLRLNPQAQVYTFNHVFPPETLQAEFFTETTLPLVRDLLSGQNGLAFTYGVSNSGKTYTIQGGSKPNTAGLLPRTLDVVFNSLEGLHSNAPYRPVRLAGVEHSAYDESLSVLSDLTNEKAIADALGESSSQGVDTTKIKVDKNYEYAIWISYAEVYNEKVYDLLSSGSSEADGTGHSGTPQGSTGIPRSTMFKKLPRSTSTWQNLATLTTSSSSDVLLVKRKALTLKSDPDSGGKFVAGLKCVRVRSADEAKRIFRAGNINRRVFGTLANATSSRSHGIFTLQVVRVHRADHSDVTVSRLSIVDLAGSERTKNTQNTGDRLKEAGSINKSLMVLGQCMEALRTNQRRLAATLAAPGRGRLGQGSDHSNMKLAIVPFRHSKLTELFQDFFVGEREGRAVMIVNVNPYDTGFDENSHVMRFAALAREITTAPTAVPPKATIRASVLAPTPKVQNGQAPHKQAPRCRTVTISTGGAGGRKQSETHLEIVEEDEEATEDNDEPDDLLIDTLFEELEDLRVRLYESEMRCAIIEAETRDEVMREMQEQMMIMERRHAKRLMHAVEQNEAKTDAKIDMLHQFGAFNSKSRSTSTNSSDTEDLASEINESFGSAGGNSRQTKGDAEDDEHLSSDDHLDVLNISLPSSPSTSSPLQRKSKYTKTAKAKLDSGPHCIGLRDEDMSIDQIDADETMTIGDGEETEGSEDDVLLMKEDTEGDSTSQDESGDEGDDDDETEDEDEDEWAPPQPSIKSSQSKSRAHPTPKFKPSRNTSGEESQRKVSGLQKQLGTLSLYADEDEEPVVPTVQEAKENTTQDANTFPKKSNASATRRSTRRSKD